MLRICAYHSNLYFPEFKLHLQEMKEKGFTVILFAITQQDILFNLVIFEEFADFARSEGMAVLSCYWGFNSVGEAICTELSPHNYLKAMKSIGITNILIDEQKQIEDIKWFTDHNDFTFYLCLDDATFNRFSDETIKNMPVKMIGVSVYHWVEDWNKVIERTDGITKRLYELRPNDNFVFIQTFDIFSGMENLPAVVKQISESNGITNFACWSFRATAATGTKRSLNKDKIWSLINW